MSVRAMDDEVDDMNCAMYALSEIGMAEHPDQIAMYIHAMGLSQTFKCIADLSTNIIAEDVIYLISGQIVLD